MYKNRLVKQVVIIKCLYMMPVSLGYGFCFMLYTVSQKKLYILFLLELCQMSTNFNKIW